jgi:hypothetical protein
MSFSMVGIRDRNELEATNEGEIGGWRSDPGSRCQHHRGHSYRLRGRNQRGADMYYVRGRVICIVRLLT